MKIFTYLSLLTVLVISSTNCVTIFSEYQSADTLGADNSEITPATSFVSYSNEGEVDHIQTNYGVQYGMGISEDIDLRFRFEAPSVGDDGSRFGDFYVFGFGPKVKLIEGRLAGYVPLGFAFGKDVKSSESFEIHPSLIFTYPVSKDFEFNPSLKIIMPFSEERDPSVALNFGLAMWQGNVGLRPEIGIMKSLSGGEGTFMHIGIGISLRN